MSKITKNKQTSKEWLATDNLLSYDRSRSQYLSIPNDSRYDCIDWNKDWSISTILRITQPSTFAAANILISKRDGAGKGWMLEFDSSTHKLVWFWFTNDSTYSSASSNSGIVEGNLNHFTVTYVSSSRTITFYQNSIPVGSTIMATQSISYTNTGAIQLNNTTLFGGNWIGSGNQAFTSIYNKTLTTIEIEIINNEIGLIPKSLHTNCVGYWPMQEKYGSKAYDCIEQFNYAKTTTTNFTTEGTGSIGKTDWKNPSGTGVSNSAFSVSLYDVLSSGGGYYEKTFSGSSTYPMTTASQVTLTFNVNNVQWKVELMNGTTVLQTQNFTHLATTNGVQVTFNNVAVGNKIRVTTLDWANALTGTYGYDYIDWVSEKMVTAGLTANHGDLIGYSTDEIAEISKNTSKKDYYTKQFSPFPIKFTGVDNNLYISHADSSTLGVNQGEFTYIVDFIPTKVVTQQYLAFKGLFSLWYANMPAIGESGTGGSAEGFYARLSNYGGTITSCAAPYTSKKKTRVIVKFKNVSNNREITLFANGAEIGRTTMNPSSIGWSLIYPSDGDNYPLRMFYTNDTNDVAGGYRFQAFNIAISDADCKTYGIYDMDFPSSYNTNKKVNIYPSKVDSSTTNTVLSEEGITATYDISAATLQTRRLDKMGLPEVKNCFKSTAGTSNNVSTSTISSGNPAYTIFQDEYTVRLFVNIATIPSSDVILYKCLSSTDEFFIIVNANDITYRKASATTGITIAHNNRTGFYGITVTRDKNKSKVNMFVNYRTASSTSGSVVSLTSNNCTGVMHTVGSATTDTYYCVSYMYPKESNVAEHLDWYKNSLTGNFNVPNKTVIYWQYNQIDTTSGNRILDVSGNNNHGTIANYVVGWLLPANINNVIKPSELQRFNADIEFQAYKNRVIADGGVIMHENHTKEIIQILKYRSQYNSKIHIASPSMGVKYRTSGSQKFIQKLYCLNGLDIVQVSNSLQPELLQDSSGFWYANFGSSHNLVSANISQISNYIIHVVLDLANNTDIGYVTIQGSGADALITEFGKFKQYPFSGTTDISYSTGKNMVSAQWGGTGSPYWYIRVNGVRPSTYGNAGQYGLTKFDLQVKNAKVYFTAAIDTITNEFGLSTDDIVLTTEENNQLGLHNDLKRLYLNI